MDNQFGEQRLLDYFSGELSDKEREAVEHWMNANPENKRKFKSFRRNFLDMRWGIRGNLIQGDFKIIERKLRKHKLYRIGAIAASVAIVLGCVCWMLVYLQKAPSSSVEVVQNIQPGSPRAVLVLSNGEQITMDSITQNLKEKDGASIQIDAEGKICYTASSLAQTLYNKVIVPKGGEFSIVLSDSTYIRLNSESELQYPVSFPANGERTVLLKGEGYFEIAPNPHNPFVVQVDGTAVKAYGTIFDINNYTPGQVETVLVEGSVGIRCAQQETKILPGQKATWKTLSEKIEVENVDIHSYIAWKDGDFVFNNETLESIMEKLSRWYNVEVFFANDEARHIRFSGDMKRYSEVSTLLYFFEETSDIHVNIKGNCLIIE